MEIIEFLERTDSKSLKNFITFKVKQKINDYEMGLQQRQQILRDIMTFENTQLNEELLLMVNQRLETTHRQRMDWINTKMMQREQARQELLKLKKQQRDLENCEEWHHMQTQQLLLATKEAQLSQIEEKKALRLKEARLEQNWRKAMERLRQEQQFQYEYEEKLRKVIEDTNQQKNLEICESAKQQQQMLDEQLKWGYHEDNIRAMALDVKSKTDERLRLMHKKVQQERWLKTQIKDNRERQLMANQQALHEDLIYRDREDYQIFIELDENGRKKVRNNEWHKLYLQHCQQEKQQRQNVAVEHENKYLNTGCVLQQSQKRPYNRQCR